MRNVPPGTHTMSGYGESTTGSECPDAGADFDSVTTSVMAHSGPMLTETNLADSPHPARREPWALGPSPPYPCRDLREPLIRNGTLVRPGRPCRVRWHRPG